MTVPLQILIVEDSEDDVQLLAHELRRAGVEFCFERVAARETMSAALARRTWDLVISDYNLPGFSGMEALSLTREQAGDLPFIMVSGVMGEEMAVETMKAGAHDYILKANLARLAPAVKRELHEAAVRRDRRQAEKALREARDYTEKLIQSMADMLVVVSPEGRILTANQAACRLLGYPKQELIGQPAHLLFQEEEEEEEEEETSQLMVSQQAFPVKRTVLRQLMRQGHISSVEKSLRTKSGTTIPVLLSGAVMRREGGGIRGIVCLALDITERKRADDALRESERFARATLDGLSAHIAIVNERGTIEAVNEAWRDFAAANGLAPERVSEGVDYFEICERASGQDAEGAREFARAVRDVHAGRRDSYQMEYPCHSPDEQRWFNVRVTRFPGDGPARAVIAHENITERRRAEEERNRILNLSRDLICIACTDGYFKYVNPAWDKVLGYTREELLSRPFRDFVHPDDHGKNDEEVARLASGEPNAGYEDRYVHKDGSVRIIEWTAAPLPEAGMMYCVGRDVTARRKAEEEAWARQAELVHVSRLNMMGELASGLAHELNQPLTTILSGTELLHRLIESKIADPAELAETLRVIGGEAERAGQIIHRLRKLVLKREVQRSTVDINDIIREAAELLKRDRREYGVVLGLDLMSTQLTQGDPVQLEQVVLNLLRNAIEAMNAVDRNQRHLAIETHSRDDDAIEVAVQDTGKGVPPEAMSHLFDPFFSTKPEGMGIGLAISRSIIEAHGGRLWAESNPDRGMTFRFTLPVNRGNHHGEPGAPRTDRVCGG